MVRPVLWFDPFHQAPMFQIRSDHQWARGFVRMRPDSAFRVRYRVDRAGPGQLAVCARTDNPSRSDTGMLEWNGVFVPGRPGDWQVLEVKAGDMRDNRHAPRFGPPWVPFLMIFNTYKEDLGLAVADLRVA